MSLKEKEIKSVRTYQSVMFDKNSHTFFSQIDIPNKPKIKLKLVDNMFIEVISDTDNVYIPLTNISGIYFYNSRDEVNAKFRDEESKKPTGVKDSEIKRPR